MSELVIIKNPSATLVYHSEKGIVHHTFHRPIHGDDFRSILNAGVELLKKYGAQKWLSDDRENSALSPEDTEWSMKDWFPRAKESGWKYWALVIPESVVARMNLKQFIDQYFQQGLWIMVFTNPEDALKWLETR